MSNTLSKHDNFFAKCLENHDIAKSPKNNAISKCLANKAIAKSLFDPRTINYQPPPPSLRGLRHYS